MLHETKHENYIVLSISKFKDILNKEAGKEVTCELNTGKQFLKTDSTTLYIGEENTNPTLLSILKKQLRYDFLQSICLVKTSENFPWSYKLQVHMDLPILTKPYTDDEIKQHMDANGYISGLIYVPVSALIHLDFETFLDTISTKLVGSPLLSDVDYNLIGTNIDEDALIFKVSGNTELLFNEN